MRADFTAYFPPLYLITAVVRAGPRAAATRPGQLMRAYDASAR